MIYTSNYARQGNNPLAISISKKPPEYFTGDHLESLAPTWDIVRGIKLGKIDQREYTIQYLKLLDERSIDPEWILQLPDETMLLCYETPTDFCHRHLLAYWVEGKTGVMIPEWKNESEQKATDHDKLVDDLFNI